MWPSWVFGSSGFQSAPIKKGHSPIEPLHEAIKLFGYEAIKLLVTHGSWSVNLWNNNRGRNRQRQTTHESTYSQKRGL